MSSESPVPPTQLRANMESVLLKYVPLSGPLPAPDNSTVSVTATADKGLPCRRCLLDAKPGELVNLMSYDPFPADSVTPYRGDGPIFVHAHDCTPFHGTALPDSQLKRLLSLRAYDEKHMMIASEVMEGSQFEKVAGEMLADDKASYIHVHNAKPGCFALRVERA